ncbi:MAG: YaaL family protein [Eubacterium sp.]|nr:YaaL family protein [Eubacterium sp.]
MQMINNIQQAKKDLDCAYLNFEHATEPDLIDCYIYQLKSAQMRYKYLLDSIKQADAGRDQKSIFL